MFMNFKIFYMFKTIHKEILGKEKYQPFNVRARSYFGNPSFHSRQHWIPEEGSGRDVAQPWPPDPMGGPLAVTFTRVLGQGCPASTLFRGEGR